MKKEKENKEKPKKIKINDRIKIVKDGKKLYSGKDDEGVKTIWANEREKNARYINWTYRKVLKIKDSKGVVVHKYVITKTRKAKIK